MQTRKETMTTVKEILLRLLGLSSRPRQQCPAETSRARGPIRYMNG